MTLLGLAQLAAPSAQAAASKQTMNVSVTVNYGCNLQVSDMDFGTVAAVTGAETATARVTVNCTPGALFLLSFSPATWALTRSSAMSSSSGNTIGFNMSLATPWGIGSSSTLINGQLVATPAAKTGAYKSVETLYVIY